VLRARILTFALLVVCVVTSRAFGGDESPSAAKPTPLTDADRAFFKWWDDLGYPDLSKLPFGNVRLGQWSRSGSDPPVQDPCLGWRVRDGGTSVDVLTLDLRSHHVLTREIEGEPWNRTGFDALDLVDQASVGAGVRDGPSSWRQAVLARACEGKGNGDLAKRLLDAAQAATPERPAPKSAGLPDRYAWVREQIAKSALDALARSLSEGARSWRETSIDWERAARHFADDSNRAELESGVAALESMVADEAARTEHPPKGWMVLTEGERIPWLVHEMPEAQDWILDGAIRWTWGRVDADPPAHLRLAEMGFAAVPALLPALDDGRLTRMVNSREASSWSMRVRVWLDATDVLRVGDLAWHTLDRISGGVLATDAERAALTKGRSSRRRRAVEWFARVEPLGEARALADAVRGGSSRALELGDRLARLDPALAVTALEAAATASKDSGRLYVVQRLAEIPGDAATDALLRLLPRLSDPGARIGAAAAAFARGRSEGLADLVRTWREGLGEQEKRPAPGASSLQPTWILALDALVQTRDPAALEALAAGLADEPPIVRLAVVARFVPAGRQTSEWTDALGRTGVTVTEPPPEAPFPESSLPVLESLLAERLEDADRTNGLWGTLDVVERDPVIGEIAAYALSKRFPARWTFDAKAPSLERAKARVALANRWRAGRGKPPISPPTGQGAPAPIAYEVLRADLERASNANTAVRTAAIEAIEARGLSAFPAVLQGIHALGDDASGRGPLRALARRLSFVVAEAVLTEESAPADDSSRAALAASVGKTFTASLYTGFIRLATTKRPPGTFGVRVVAERLDAGRGVSIRVTLFKEPQKRHQGGSWGVRWLQPVVHRRGKTSFGNEGWNATERIETYTFGIWNAAIDEEIEASELDDDFLVDGRAAFER